MHPELSGEESRTARLVAQHLRDLGLDTETGVGGYGVVGVLAGANPGPTVAYRADMDALPIPDDLDEDYASVHLGISHACGHDAHTAIALGVATQLSRTKRALCGDVVFIFQPAEESLDGARAMLEDDLLTLAHPAAILALHAFPLPSGTVGVAGDAGLAGMEEFRVRFYAPTGNLEPLMAAAMSALTTLSTAPVPQDLESFEAIIAGMVRGDRSLAETVYVSCWPLPAGQEPPAHLLGLVSITDFQRRAAVRTRIKQALTRTCAAYGATYDLTITFSNPPLHNDPRLVASLLPVLKSELGDQQVLTFTAPYPFAHEDFTQFAAEIPALFLWLGTQNLERGIPSILHTPGYDIDEKALGVGVRTVVAMIRHLQAHLPDSEW